MFKERKIDGFFEQKKKSARDSNQLKPKNDLKFSEKFSAKQTLKRADIDKQLLEFDLDSRYGPSYGKNNHFS